MPTPIGDVLVDGRPTPAGEATLSIFDIGFQRGYGCFEAMRSYHGTIFRLEQHIARLTRSASMLHLPLPPEAEIAAWCRAAAFGDCIVRVLVSGGTDMRRIGTGSRVYVCAEAIDPFPDRFTLQTRVAPWHSDGTLFELTGAKALSYGFNLAATIAARTAGFDDALLVGESGNVLEGPTFSIAWVTGGVVHTPGLELGILDSITRHAVLDAGRQVDLPIVAAVYPRRDLMAADEVMMMSTLRQVMAVAAVDDREFPAGPVTARVGDLFAALVAEETG